MALMMALAAAALLCGAGLAFAAEPVSVKIPVTIEEGGIAVMAPVGDAPAPETAELALDDGERGAFEIALGTPGTYGYTVRIKDEGIENVEFDTTVYTATVAVFADEGSGMYAMVTVAKTGAEDKPEMLMFANKGRQAALHPGGSNDPAKPDDPDDPGGSDDPDNPGGSDDPDNPGGSNDPDDPGSNPDDPGKGNNDPDKDNGQTAVGTTDSSASSTGSGAKSTNPRTGDSSNLEFYLLMAAAASAGLFLLSLVFALSVRKDRKRAGRR